jgi:integrase
VSIYVKPCAKCRNAGGEKRTQNRKRKACPECRWIAIAPPKLGRKSLGSFKNLADAERALRDALSNHDRGIDLAPASVTVEEIVTRYNADCRTRCGVKTVERFEDLAKLNIRPHLGSLQARKLRPAHVAEWCAKMLASGGHKGKPLSPSTVRHAFRLLSAALRWGVRMQLVARNVCDDVRAPSVTRTDAKALTQDEIRALLKAAARGRWAPLILVSLTTGLRRGELCALKWRDVDLEGGILTVRASLSQTRARGIELKAPKSGKARTVPLSKTAIDAFRAQHVRQTKERLRAGTLWETTDAVFADPLGRHTVPQAMTRAYEWIAEKAGISSLRLHDCRHTAATEMLVGGVDVVTAAGVLGHASPTVTLQVYGHVVEEARRAAVDRLGERIGRASTASEDGA